MSCMARRGSGVSAKGVKDTPCHTGVTYFRASPREDDPRYEEGRDSRAGDGDVAEHADGYDR